MVCEACWAEAYGMSLRNGESQYDNYIKLVRSRPTCPHENTGDATSNELPTKPGYHYHKTHGIVEVIDDGDGLLFLKTGKPHPYSIKNDGEWMGPVPAAGEWVAKSETEFSTMRQRQ